MTKTYTVTKIDTSCWMVEYDNVGQMLTRDTDVMGFCVALNEKGYTALNDWTALL